MRKNWRFLLALGLCAAFGLTGILRGQNVSTVSSMQVDGGTGRVYAISGAGATVLPVDVGGYSAYGTSTLPTGNITTGICGTPNSIAIAGALATDRVVANYTSSPAGVADKALTLVAYMTAGNVNIVQCNATAGTITPTGLVVAYQVIR